MTPQPQPLTPFEAGRDAVVVIDRQGRIRDWSAAAEEAFGWNRADMLGRLLAVSLIAEVDRDAFCLALEHFQETGDSRILGRPMEIAVVAKHGEQHRVLASVTPLHLPTETLCTVVFHDRSPPRTFEGASDLVREWQSLQSSVAAPLDQDTFEEALASVLELLCKLTGWPAGQVWMADPSGQFLRALDIWSLAAPDSFARYRADCIGKTVRPGEGVVGSLWLRGEPGWVNVLGGPQSAGAGLPPVDRLDAPQAIPAGQFAQDPEIIDHLPLDPAGGGSPVLPADIEGAFGFPVKIDGEAIALLVFWTRAVVAPDPQLILLVTNLGNQLGRVLERQRWQEERNRLAAIVDSSRDAIIAKDRDGFILSWNNGAEEIYGFSRHEAVGRSIRIVLPPGLEDEEEPLRDAVRRGDCLRGFETERLRRDRARIFVSITISPIRDSKGRIVGSSTIERDITALKEREQDLRRAITAAQAANLAKSEFLANVSHELRTPMNAILGMLQLSLTEPLSSEIRDYLETAFSSADTLLQLLNDLLDFSRMEAGRFELEIEPFRLREAIEGPIRALSARAAEKGLELVCQIGLDVPEHVEGDDRRLRQVLMNLVGNALKFTEAGEVVVTAETARRTADEVELLLSVADTGEGIAAENLERIFAPFTQADASTTRRHTGTGLGLAICRELVERMGGRIQATSELGRGSRFSCTIRLRVLPQLPSPPPREISGLEVLVVDDNRTNGKILEESLASWEMRPTVVRHAREALDIAAAAQAEGRPFPLMIIDALMPEIDGFALIEELQGRGLADSARILMLSSADRHIFKDRYQNLDIDLFLEKPISQSDLLEAVLTALMGDLPIELQNGRPPRSPVRLAILLAEDTPANQKFVRSALERLGHQVDVAHNGREAVDLVKQKSFDIVLMDVQMPTMDGLQATQAIRSLADPEKSAVTIIAMTAHARREDRLRCYAVGMDAYLSKPIDIQKLLECIDSAPRRASMERAAKPSSFNRTESLPAEPPSGPIMNREAALARMGGDNSLLLDMARFFLEDAPDALVAIETQLAASNAEELERAAHSLKGLAASFDGIYVMQAAEQLERAAKRGDLSAAPPLLATLRQEVARLVAELEALLRA